MHTRRVVSAILMIFLLTGSFAPLISAQEATPVTEDQIELTGEDTSDSLDQGAESSSDAPDEPDTDDDLLQESLPDSTPEQLLGRQSILMSPNQTEPPALTIEGRTGAFSANTGYEVSFGKPDGTEIGIFEGAVCGGIPAGGWNDISSTTSNSEATLSYQARWAGEDDLLSNCVTITWRIPPQLLVSGSTADRILRVSQTVTFGIPAGAKLAHFPGAGCQGDSDTWVVWSNTAYTYEVPAVVSLQLRWGDEDLTRGNCVTVTWAASPTLLIDGSTDDREAPLNVTLPMSAPNGTQFAPFTGAGCLPENRDASWTSALTGARSTASSVMSYQARWGTDNNSRGNCITINFVHSPTMSVDGTYENRVIPARQSILLSAPNRAQHAAYEGAECQGSPIGDWSTSAYSWAENENRTLSFQARWGTDDSTRGNCVTVTWLSTLR